MNEILNKLIKHGHAIKYDKGKYYISDNKDKIVEFNAQDEELNNRQNLVIPQQETPWADTVTELFREYFRLQIAEINENIRRIC